MLTVQETVHSERQLEGPHEDSDGQEAVFLQDVWEKFQKQQQPAGRHENHRVENGEASRQDATELKHQITDDGEIICD